MIADLPKAGTVQYPTREGKVLPQAAKVAVLVDDKPSVASNSTLK
ncbi:hypothetical protein [Ferrimicrobium acidiphilum]|nr:hypothetical protein [Ferrimicrobium acidiphilum]